MVTCSSTEAWNLCFWIHDIFTVPSTIVYKILYWLWHVLLGGFFLLWCCDPTWVMASSFLMFLDHTRRCTTVGRTPLDEWSARRRDLYLTTRHSQQTSIHAPGGIRTHGTDCGASSSCDLETSRMGAPYIYDISSLRVNDLTLILLTWRKWWTNNASKWQMGFNSMFKGLMLLLYLHPLLFIVIVSKAWHSSIYQALQHPLKSLSDSAQSNCSLFHIPDVQYWRFLVAVFFSITRNFMLTDTVSHSGTWEPVWL